LVDVDGNQARRLAREVMAGSQLAIVSTTGLDGYPMARAMFNLCNAGQFPGLAALAEREASTFRAYFGTNTSLPKVAQLRADPRMCAYYHLPSSFRGLSLMGDVQFVEDGALKEEIWQPGWELYYPLGPTDPDYTVFRLVPTAAHYYHRLEHARFDPRELLDN
jgi:general stress protein 26